MINKSMFKEIFASLLADLDFKDSSFAEYTESLIFNTILKELTIEKRKEFVNLIEITNNSAIFDYLQKNIPDLENLLRKKLVSEISYIEKFGGNSK